MEQQKNETPKFSSYQIFVVILLAFLQFTIIIDFAIISPLGDMLMKALTIEPSQFGLLVSSYAFCAGFSGLLATGFADRFDRKKFLLFFYCGFVIGTFLCGLASTYEMLLIARSLTGLFGGVIGSISLSIVSDLFALNQRGRVMGYIQMAFAGSQILGIPVGLFLANHWGWNSTFLMIALVSVIISPIILFKLKPITEHLKLQTAENIFIRFWNVLSNKNYQIGFLLIMLISIGGSMLMPFSSAFLINNVGITQEQLPLVFMFTGMATMIIMPLVGRLSDKIDKFKLFLIGSIISIVVTIIYTNLTPIPMFLLIIVNICMFVGIMSRMVPASSLNTAVPHMKDRGSYMSLCSSLQQMSNGIAAMFAGFIVVQATPESPLYNYNILGYIVAVTSIVCIYLIYVVNKRIQQRK